MKLNELVWLEMILFALRLPNECSSERSERISWENLRWYQIEVESNCPLSNCATSSKCWWADSLSFFIALILLSRRQFHCWLSSSLTELSPTTRWTSIGSISHGYRRGKNEKNNNETVAQRRVIFSAIRIAETISIGQSTSTPLGVQSSPIQTTFSSCGQ